MGSMSDKPTICKELGLLGSCLIIHPTQFVTSVSLGSREEIHRHPSALNAFRKIPNQTQPSLHAD